MQTSARVVADSIHRGYRVTTMEITFHRTVLAEFNTHRMFSRNSASSRAIPIEKMLMRAIASPAWPLTWRSEQPGMQGGEELTGDDLVEAKALLENCAEYTVRQIDAYVKSHPDKSTRLHKSYVNRMLEWFSWHTAIVTSVEWDNFFAQRAHPKAQPEIEVLADMMRVALDASIPVELEIGQWHTPYIQPDEADLIDEVKLPVSAARCARVSYLTQNGVRSLEDDVALFYDRLLAGITLDDDPPHWSPLEHVCTPDNHEPDEEILGNLGFAAHSVWAQLRHHDPLDVWHSRPDITLLREFETVRVE